MVAYEDQVTNLVRTPVRIVSQRSQNKEKQYLVHWKDSWEPEENLKGLQE